MYFVFLLTGFLLQVHSNGGCMDDEILADPEIQEAIKNEGKVHRKFDIVNTDRATLGRIGGAIAKLHGDSGFAGQVSIDFEVCTPCLTLLSNLAVYLCCLHLPSTLAVYPCCLSLLSTLAVKAIALAMER